MIMRVSELREEKQRKQTLKSMKDQNENKKSIESIQEIPELLKILKQVNKEDPINNRVKQVLNAMGLQELEVEEQKVILNMICSNIDSREIDYMSMMQQADLWSVQKHDIAAIINAQFINDFVNKFHQDKKMGIGTFIRLVQSEIILENELKYYPNIFN